MARPKRPKLYASAPTCEGKKRYGSEHEAEHVREEQELIFPALQLRVYRCTAGCGGWHLTRRKPSL